MYMYMEQSHFHCSLNLRSLYKSLVYKQQITDFFFHDTSYNPYLLSIADDDISLPVLINFNYHVKKIIMMIRISDFTEIFN
jgi:hypothetical protein